MAFIDFIQNHIRQHGAIPFVEFMQQALYAPNVGYYNSGLQKFGKAGDFVTSPELTPLFGQTLALQCQQLFNAINQPILFEFGAGTGRLCVDILRHLEHLGCLPDAYYILELSAHLKQRQAALMQQHIPHLLYKVHWLSSWPTQSFDGIVIANEVLDAMPIHRFLQTESEILESYITLNAQGELCEEFKPCTDVRLLQHIQTVLPRDLYPYQSEANLFLESWLKQCYAMLNKGAMLLVDYGFPRHEYYHPDRRQGTLMCHYHHQAHANALLYPGEQDITAHVDFTQVAEAAFNAGFHVAGYTNQAAFLLANGLLSLLLSIANENERIKEQQAVKQLTQPHEMGELFKVIALTKQLDMALLGFQLQDKRASL
jgi:SAM-dependent MidA family methyltransferase